MGAAKGSESLETSAEHWDTVWEITVGTSQVAAPDGGGQSAWYFLPL